ncbi:MAG: hypothetical protein JO230_01925 [Xanthobacteraceae bacterium]|nr:hypothetical protein [Xanthobacteraceae bacterium]
MNMHKNARLTPLGRERIVRQVESGQTLETVAEGAGVCSRPFASGLSDIAEKDGITSERIFWSAATRGVARPTVTVRLC